MILLIRSWLYSKLVAYCDQLTSIQLNHFGMFLGNYFTNKGVAILVTLLILCFIATCLLLSKISIGYLTEVSDIMKLRMKIQLELEQLLANPNYIPPQLTFEQKIPKPPAASHFEAEMTSINNKGQQVGSYEPKRIDQMMS
jgi:hypothetical protein